MPYGHVHITIIKLGETRQGLDIEKRQKKMLEMTREDVPG